MSYSETEEAKKDNVVADKYPWGAYIYDAAFFIGVAPVGGAPAMRESLVRMVDPKPGETITELCCGTGSVALKIHKITGRGVWASDISSEQVRVARIKAEILRSDIRFEIKDASNTGFTDSFFDKVVISIALHEIKRKRRIAIYREVKRILKPGGSFFVSEPEFPSNRWGKVCFRTFFGSWNPESATALELIRGGLEKEISNEGFELRSVSRSSFEIILNLEFKKNRPPVSGYLRVRPQLSFDTEPIIM